MVNDGFKGEGCRRIVDSRSFFAGHTPSKKLVCFLHQKLSLLKESVEDHAEPAADTLLETKK